jgi:peptide/nickel transport system substrate-binding protein
MTQPRYLRSARITAAGLAVGALLLTGCAATVNKSGTSSSTSDNTNAMLTIPREDMSTFDRNFNPFAPAVNPMVNQAIYEPLLVFNPAKGDTTPWLATEWKTAADGKSITFTLRDGVKWSDGKPLVADDVAYTFELQKKLKGGYEYLVGATAEGTNKVTFTFNKPWSPALYEVGQLPILPKHIWSAIADPAKDANATPVGTGPYTEVDSFQAQSYALKKNPNYWQPEKQKIAGIKMLAMSGNDAANLASVNGDVDWSTQFIPNIEKTFISKDKEHRHYWFPPTGAMINWQLNTTKAPFNDPKVRKALSMAVDRDQVTKIGMSGYAQSADCTGLSGNYEKWKNPAVKDNCSWTKLNVDEANKVLDEAGYPKGADGKRTLKDGTPFEFKISVGASSSDWLSVANVISQNLQAVGVTAKVDSPDWASVVAGYEQGTFDSGIVWSANDPSPFKYFNNAMGSATVKPVGTKTFDNYHRFGDPKADALLQDFVAAGDEAKQKDVAYKLQEEYNDAAPLVPLFSGPEWGDYTDVHFTGWPSQDNPYATLSDRSPTTVLILTTLEPRK